MDVSGCAGCNLFEGGYGREEHERQGGIGAVAGVRGGELEGYFLVAVRDAGSDDERDIIGGIEGYAGWLCEAGCPREGGIFGVDAFEEACEV